MPETGAKRHKNRWIWKCKVLLIKGLQKKRASPLSFEKTFYIAKCLIIFCYRNMLLKANLGMVQKYRFSGNSMLDTLLCLAVAGTATLYVHEIFIISSVTLN